MIGAVATFVLLGGVLVAAAIVLTRATDTIAEATGLGRLWMGSVLLAGATSLPELGVDISAVRQGHVNLAIGDIYGSSMANMLILAVLGLSPPRDDIFRRASVSHTLGASLGMILTAVSAVLIYSQSATSWGGVNPASILLLLLFLVGSRIIYVQSAGDHNATTISVTAEGAGEAHARRGWGRAALKFAAAAAVILVVSPRFASSAHTIAIGTGMGTTFFGTIFVGASTSLPEIVSCITAVRMGAFDLAVGNLFGSNLFNVVIFLAMDIAHAGGSLYVEANPSHVVSALFGIVLMALGSASVAFRAGRRFALVEPGSWLMIIAYLSGVVALYQLRDMQ